MPATNILSDIRVADMTTVMFGPYCTQTLADMGADVIKIEPPAGDMMRYGGKPANTRGMGPMHMTINRGKRSVALDQKTEIGKEATRRLIETSDIFIHNVLDSSIKRLNLSFDEVKEIKKDIVYVHCTGFSSQGPYAGKPAFDDIIQSLSGMTTLIPRLEGDEPPRCLPTMIVDKVSALHAVYAVLAALRERDKTGEAVFVEVPMFECATHFLLEDHFDGAVFDPPSDDFGFKRSFERTLQPMKTKDDWIMIAPYTDSRWLKTFEVLGATKELEDEKLKDRKSRFYNSAYMHQRMHPYLETNTTEHWVKVFTEAKIPAARVNSFKDLYDDPHLKATNFFTKREHNTEGDYWEIQPPVKFHNKPEKEIQPAPHIGEHTDSILAELGIKAESDNGS